MGSRVGMSVGSAVGTFVGRGVGIELGALVGLPDGTGVGARVIKHLVLLEGSAMKPSMQAQLYGVIAVEP